MHFYCVNQIRHRFNQSYKNVIPKHAKCIMNIDHVYSHRKKEFNRLLVFDDATIVSCLAMLREHTNLGWFYTALDVMDTRNV